MPRCARANFEYKSKSSGSLPDNLIAERAVNRLKWRCGASASDFLDTWYDRGMLGQQLDELETWSTDHLEA